MEVRDAGPILTLGTVKRGVVKDRLELFVLGAEHVGPDGKRDRRPASREEGVRQLLGQHGAFVGLVHDRE